VPCVIFPKEIFRFVSFHVRFIRKYIINAAKVEESNFDNRPLIIHTEDGYPLRVPQILSTIRRFFVRIDPELPEVTVMSLRARYASMALQKYHQGTMFSELSEAKFLEYLSKVMNTSVEQLAATYATADRENFAESAQNITSMIGHAVDVHTESDVGSNQLL